MLQQAKRDGLITANWAREIDTLIKPASSPEDKGLKHTPSADCTNIRNHLIQVTYYSVKQNGEWLGHACDLLLYIPSRPAEAVNLRDESGTLAKTVM